MKYVVKAMYFLGIRKSADNSLNSRSIHICSTLFYLFLTISNIISNIAYLFVYDVDLATVSETLCTVGSFVKAFALLITHLLLKDKMYELVDEMEKMKLNRKRLIESGDDNSETANREGITLTKCMIIVNSICLVIVVFAPLVQGLRTQNLHLHFTGWFPFDTIHGFNFAVAYLIQALGITIGIMHATLFELFSILIMIHISLEFQNVRHNFLNLVERNIIYIYDGMETQV